MSVQLRKKGAPKLLRSIAGRRHAAPEDYVDWVADERAIAVDKEAEIEVEISRATAPGTRHWESEDEDIYGSPVSSGDEAPAPVSPISAHPPPLPPPPPPPPLTTVKAPKSRAMDIAKPAVKRKSSRNMLIKPPAKGNFAQNIKEKKKRMGNKGEDEEKENIALGLSGQEKETQEEDVDGPKWRVENPMSRKRRWELTGNIHKLPIKSNNVDRKEFGVDMLGGNPRSSQPLNLKKPTTYGRQKAPVLNPDPIDNEDDSESEDFLVKLELPCTKAPKVVPESTPAKRRKPNLMELANLIKDQTPTYTSGSQNVSLPNLEPCTSGNSTPLSSLPSAHHPETLRNIEKYCDDLQSESDTVDKCPICEELVDPVHYATFWRGKKKTVLHQTAYCKEHKKQKAIEEYKSKGYPQIDWDNFPEKIKQYHPQLTAVLQNKQPSHYREIHAQRLADRDERTVRKLLDSDAIFDATTGYYGSRGKRAMMEAIVSQLGHIIRKCVKNDPVVAFNGFANFVQAVLVPELTVWLVMDELECSEMKAREVVEESGPLGEVVNEEVEDWVGVVESEESEDSEVDSPYGE